MKLLVQSCYRDRNLSRDMVGLCMSTIDGPAVVSIGCFKLRTSLFLIRLEKMKMLMVPGMGKDVGERALSHCAARSVNWHSFRGFPLKLKWCKTLFSTSFSRKLLYRYTCICVQRKLYTDVDCSGL